MVRRVTHVWISEFSEFSEFEGGDVLVKTYEVLDLVDGTKAIKCLRCGLTSYNPNDVDQLYCAACHTFHEARITAFVPMRIEDWSKPAQDLYAGMVESYVVNGQVIVPGEVLRAAEEIMTALREGRAPRFP